MTRASAKREASQPHAQPEHHTHADKKLDQREAEQAKKAKRVDQNEATAVHRAIKAVARPEATSSKATAAPAPDAEAKAPVDAVAKRRSGRTGTHIRHTWGNPVRAGLGVRQARRLGRHALASTRLHRPGGCVARLVPVR